MLKITYSANLTLLLLVGATSIYSKDAQATPTATQECARALQRVRGAAHALAAQIPAIRRGPHCDEQRCLSGIEAENPNRRAVNGVVWLNARYRCWILSSEPTQGRETLMIPMYSMFLARPVGAQRYQNVLIDPLFYTDPTPARLRGTFHFSLENGRLHGRDNCWLSLFPTAGCVRNKEMSLELHSFYSSAVAMKGIVAVVSQPDAQAEQRPPEQILFCSQEAEWAALFDQVQSCDQDFRTFPGEVFLRRN